MARDNVRNCYFWQHAAWLLVLVAVIIRPAVAWHACSPTNDSGAIVGICPDGNKCCYDASSSHFNCLPGSDATQGECCAKDDSNGTIDRSTGCGQGFACARNLTANSTYSYCSRVDPNDDTLPDAVPRYLLCSVQPDRILTQVHGLPISSEDGSATGSAVAAYLSTRGAIDSSDPETLADQAGIETAWIVIHGSGRNVDDYVCCAISAAALESSVMILAPWFLSPKDPPVNITSSSRLQHAAAIAQPPRVLVWAEEGPIDHTWRYGANAVDRNISSYAVVDEMLRRLVSDRRRFPALRRIVVAGHSAGGQYVQRWALLSNGAAFADPAKAFFPRVPTRVVVANPKSFCWLDERRMFNGTLRKPQGDAVYLCPTYDEWEWGFQNSTKSSERDALNAPYVQAAIRDAGGIGAVVARYPSRDVVYLAGEMDVLFNGECEDKMQGPYRRVRSANFYASLREIFGRPIHHRLVVASVNHDHCLMFQSPEGRQALFGSFVRDEASANA